MVSIIRFTTLLLLLLVNHLSRPEPITTSKSAYSPIILDDKITSENPRQVALKILQNKCNVCHSKRNKRRVFTIKNMDDFAPDIYEQVFVKKRMPKGRQIKLTSEEYQDILTWISTTKK